MPDIPVINTDIAMVCKIYQCLFLPSSSAEHIHTLVILCLYDFIDNWHKLVGLSHLSSEQRCI